jgi:ATP phosphoribosyltransferase
MNGPPVFCTSIKRHDVLRIAIPNKGRLADDVRDLFRDAGLELSSRGDRALVASFAGGQSEAIFVRSADIPEFVADGAADAGITGWDLVAEAGRPLETLLDLEFGACRLVVAARDGSGIDTLGDVPEGARVATVFPRLTARFFADAGRQVEIVPVSGAAEIAPHLGIADLVVDLTSTGSTMRVHNLKELGTVLCSTARFLVRPESRRHPALDEIVTAFASVLHGRRSRYLMANIPRGRLDEVKRVIPGLGGPTVIDILNGGDTVAVHAVVALDAVSATIAQLKHLGAKGILVTRIERLMP